MNVNAEELKVLLEPGRQAQEEVVKLTAQVARLESKLEKFTIPMTVPDDSRNVVNSQVLDLLTNVCHALARNEKIRAIKIVREFTHVGLKEAKDIVEGNYSGPGVSLKW